MATNETNARQGPFAGSRCVAGPGGHWAAATVRRVNEDGTFTIEFDVKEMTIMPYWYGVTPAEVSFDDVGQWPAVFAELCPDGQGLTRSNFHGALTRIGFRVNAEQADQYWDQMTQARFNVSGRQAASLVLDANSSYQLCLHFCLSAKQFAAFLDADRPQAYFKLYWNQTRMGGRDPAEVCRPVTLDDAFAALGVTRAKVDRKAVAFVEAFESEHSIRLPAAWKELACRAGIADAVKECHPNNPALVPLRKGEWRLRRGMRGQQVEGDCAIVVMVPHQGDHEWAVAFDDGDADARVYVRWDTEDGEAWVPTAPGVGTFFWDLAQTGLAWFQETRFQGGKPVRPSDVGLTLDT